MAFAHQHGRRLARVQDGDDGPFAPPLEEAGLQGKSSGSAIRALWVQRWARPARERNGADVAAGPVRPSVVSGRYGVSLLIRVDQLASAVRVPGVPGVPDAGGPKLNVPPAQVPSRLSPVPPAKNGPPQSV
jgi:hypothetical protein